MFCRNLLPVWIGILILSGMFLMGQESWFDQPPPRVYLPEDESPHNMEIEWWYYTGHLDSGEEKYGFEMVIFQSNYVSYEGYMAHFAMTDKVQGLFSYDIKYSYELQEQTEEGFDLSIEDWRMKGLNGEDYLKASMDGYAIELDLVSLKEPILHGGDGLIEMGFDNIKSYYYSRSRMEVTGTLEIQGVQKEVTGIAWMDHQWGDFFAAYFLDVGWDWFSIQLEDNTELMLYSFRGGEGQEHSEGSYFDENSSLHSLEGADFQIASVDTWVSPHSGAEYPSEWEISIPEYGFELSLAPAMEDQELCFFLDTCYWEGPIAVSGTRNGEQISGWGYVELTGYQ